MNIGAISTNRYEYVPPKKTGGSPDGTRGSETIVPKVIESPQANALNKSEGTVQGINGSSNSGLDDRPRGGDPDPHEKPQPRNDSSERNQTIATTDALTLFREIQAQPYSSSNTRGRAAYAAQAHKYPAEEFHGSEDKLNLNG